MLPTCAGAIITNEKGEYLLQLRDGNAPSFQFKWTLFGGAVDGDETAEECVRRELIEEIELGDDHILSLEQTQDNVQPNGVHQYIFHVQTDGTIDDLTLHEGAEMKYVTEDELFEREFAFNIKEVLQSHISNNSK